MAMKAMLIDGDLILKSRKSEVGIVAVESGYKKHSE